MAPDTRTISTRTLSRGSTSLNIYCQRSPRKVPTIPLTSLERGDTLPSLTVTGDSSFPCFKDETHPLPLNSVTEETTTALPLAVPSHCCSRYVHLPRETAPKPTPNTIERRVLNRSRPSSWTGQHGSRRQEKHQRRAKQSKINSDRKRRGKLLTE